ncbi:MAG: hypothetical protein ACXU8R_16615, partial [Xanthobacteraceae bacterium]
MRVLILATSVLAILAGANAATAGPSTAKRDISASVEPATANTTQEAEQQTGPDKTTRRGAQHRAHHRDGGRHHRIGGPVGLVGGMVAGLFGRR